MRRFFAIILLLSSSAVLAQPASISRVLRNIDFEEHRLGNDEDLPMHWLKVEAPGFPHYVNARLTTDRAHSGTHSFRFDLNGGSLLFRYEPGQIPAQLGATYQIDGWAQTTPMLHARARMTAYFTDADGHPLPNTVVHSEIYTAAKAEDPWKKLSLQLTAHSDKAAFIVLELGLLQPELYAPDTLGQHTLHEQDIHGTAWFDDITIAQVPQVTLFTSRPGNIFRASDPLAVTMNIDDAFLLDLTSQLFVRDGSGRVVYQHSAALDEQQAKPSEGLRKRVDLPLPGLGPGWYRVSVVTSSKGKTLRAQDIDLVRLADDGVRSLPDDRFGLIATDVPFASWRHLPELVSQLGCARVKLGVWSQNADPDQIDPAMFDEIIGRFAALQITPTACLLDLPPGISAALATTKPSDLPEPKSLRPGYSWLALLRARDEQWQPQLDYLLARHATHLDRWQLGADNSDVFAADKTMREVYARLYSRFALLVHDPDLAMPWPAWYELDGQLPATVALSVPASILPNQLPLYMQEIKGGQGHHLSLSLQLPDQDRYGREVQARDMAQRVVYALSAGADRIDLPCPFSIGADSSIEQPRELLLAMRTVLTMLSRAQFKGKVPIADGVEAFLFDRQGQSVLVLWDTGRTGGVKPLAINLGKATRMFDVWGNEIPLLRTENDTASGDVNLMISPTPSFLVNLDGALAQLRSTVAIDRPFIESTYQAHSRHFRFTNTYPVAITGSLQVRGPKGWTITPSLHNFSLNPGETFDRQMTLDFPLNSQAGPRTIQLQFALQADKAVNFQIPLSIKLGLSEIGMQSVAMRDGKDVVVQLVVQNYGDQPVDYTVFALAPGQQRQERLITGLAAGKSTIRKLRFKGGALSPGTKIHVGLKEMDGPRLLNDEIEVN